MLPMPGLKSITGVEGRCQPCKRCDVMCCVWQEADQTTVLHGRDLVAILTSACRRTRACLIVLLPLHTEPLLPLRAWLGVMAVSCSLAMCRRFRALLSM